ncbi:TetR/AcrR family transcriptional regulator [Cupriavidus basilensis]
MNTIDISEETEDEYTRRRILEAADTVLARDSRRLRPDDIAKQAGVSKKTIYRLFKSKAGLVDALFLRQLPQLNDPISLSDMEPQEALEALLLRIVRCAFTPVMLAVYRTAIIDSASPAFEHVATDDEPFFKEMLSSLRRYVEYLIDQNIIVPGSSLEYVKILSGMAGGTEHLVALSSNEVPTDEQIEHRVRKSVSIFLRGALNVGWEN